MFSVIIPTFNNINYLKLCIKSLEKNSAYNHELIFHINEGTDGTLDFLNNTEYKFSYSSNNKGVCVAFNEAVKISTKKYIVLGHDDMYFCPEWDEIFNQELKKYDDDKDFFLSGTMVQPFESYIYLDCGKTINDFNEQKLLSNLPKISYNDFQGTHWQPSLIPRSTWNKVGGFSEEFSPGAGSDPDLNMKMWQAGVRIFKGLSNSKVYHFGSITIRKKNIPEFKKNIGSRANKKFLMKWGITIGFFKKYYLKSDTFYQGPLEEPKKNINYLINLIKIKISYFYY